MDRMHTTGRTELSQFQTLRIILLVFRRGVVAMLANRAGQRRNDAVLFPFSGHVFLLIYKIRRRDAIDRVLMILHARGRDQSRPYDGVPLS